MSKNNESFDERLAAERNLNLPGVRGIKRTNHRNGTTTFSVSDTEVAEASGIGLMLADDYLRVHLSPIWGLFDNPNGVQSTNKGIKFLVQAGQFADDMEKALEEAINGRAAKNRKIRAVGARLAGETDSVFLQRMAELIK